MSKLRSLPAYAPCQALCAAMPKRRVRLPNSPDGLGMGWWAMMSWVNYKMCAFPLTAISFWWLCWQSGMIFARFRLRWSLQWSWRWQRHQWSCFLAAVRNQSSTLLMLEIKKLQKAADRGNDTMLLPLALYLSWKGRRNLGDTRGSWFPVSAENWPR